MKRFLKRFILAVVITLAMVAPAAAQDAQLRATGNKVMEQNAEGVLIYNGNELKNVSVILAGDAAFIKVVSPVVPGESGGGGGFSIDAGDTSRNVPLVELLGALYRDGAEGKIVVLNVGAGLNPNDNDYTTVMEFNSEAVVFRVPVVAPNLGGSAPNVGAWPGCMASGIPGDPYRWQFCQQGTDGNVVSYEVVQGNACARWSAYHGVIPKHTSPIAACRQ